MRYTIQEPQEHFDHIETELGSPMPPSVSITTSSSAEVCSSEYNRYRTGKCLQTCAEVLCHIDEAQLQLLLDRTPPRVGQASFDITSRGLGKAHIMTAAALQECSNKLNQTLSLLYVHIEKIDTSLPVSSSPADKNFVVHNHQPGSKRSLILENASVGKDGRQTIISTAGDVLEVRQATAGDRAVQFVGSVSDTKLHEMLKDKSL